MGDLKFKTNSTRPESPIVRMDFETRSAADLKKVGAYKYASHPSTDVICLRWAVGEGPVRLWHRWAKNQEMPKELKEAIFQKKYQTEAHNKLFEELIWHFVMHLKYGWPDLPDNWDCTAARAAVMALPRSLEELGKALKLHKQKDMEGKRVMMRLSKPRRPTKKDPTSVWHESPEDLNKLFAYCGDDVESEREASKTLLPLSDVEHDIWQMDQRINRRGVFIDREAVESALYLIKELGNELTQELVGITGGLVQSAAELRNIHEYIESQGQSLPNLQAQTVEEALTIGRDIYTPDVIRVLEIRSVLNKASTKKYQAMLSRMSDDDRVREILMYCGASTGRDAGAGIQIQNLPAGRNITDQNVVIDMMKCRDLDLFKMCFADPFKTISGVIRGMICASPGKVLRSVDYNAIEARVLFWLSGCQLGMKEYREKLDIYKAMAAEVFGVKLEDVTKEQRDLGKRIVLGAGFGMGWRKFVITCKTQGNLVIEDSLAQKGIAAYRNRYRAVPQFWKELEGAAFRVVQGSGPRRVGKLLLESEKNCFTIKLPSDRKLYYWYPSIKEQMTDYGPKDSIFFWYVDSQTRKWVEGPTYGGMLCENVVQATARDVMKYRSLVAEKEGYTPLFFVHDEIVTEDDKDFGSIKELENIMAKIPTWAEGLPVAVEGWEDARYHK